MRPYASKIIWVARDANKVAHLLTAPELKRKRDLRLRQSVEYLEDVLVEAKPLCKTDIKDRLLNTNSREKTYFRKQIFSTNLGPAEEEANTTQENKIK